jgi:hypothetical protein
MGLLQRFMILLDPRDKSKFEQDMKEAGRKGGQHLGDEVQKSGGKIGAVFSKIGAAIGAAFAVHKLIEFGKRSLQAANEADKGWNEVALTLQNNGSSLELMRGKLEALGATMLKTTTFTDEQALASFNSIVQITGDLANAERAVAVSADLAAARHISLEQASLLVGRAMNGNTMALKRMGIEIPKGGDALAALTEKFGGAAQNELNTFGGKVTQLANYFDELREEIGHAMISAGQGANVMDVLSGAIQGATVWVKEHADDIANLGVIAGKFVAAGFGKLAEMMAATGREFQALMRFGKLLSASFDDLQISNLKLQSVLLKGKLAIAEFLGQEDKARGLKIAIANIGTEIKSLQVTAAEKRKPISKEIIGAVEDAEVPVKKSARKMGVDLGDGLGEGVETAKKHLKDLEGEVARVSETFRAEVVEAGRELPLVASRAMNAYAEITLDVIKTLDDATKKSFSDQMIALRDSLGGRAEEINKHSDFVLITEQMTTEQRKKEFERAGAAHAEAAGKEAAAVVAAANTERAVTTETTDHSITEDERAKEAHAKNVQERINDINLWANSMSGVINAITGVASAFGGLGEAANRVLNGISKGIQDVAGLGTALASGNIVGVITSGAAVVGDVIDIVGGIFKSSKDPGRFRTNKEMYEKALKGDAEALEFLRVHSVVATKANNQQGWGSAAAAADAKAKYEAALAATQGGAATSVGRQYATPIGSVARAPSTTRFTGISLSTPTTRQQPSILVNQYGVKGENVTQKTVAAVNTALGSQFSGTALSRGSAKMTRS